MLMGKNAALPSRYADALRASVRPDGFWGEDLSALSEQLFGSSLYVNMMLLGSGLSARSICRFP